MLDFILKIVLFFSFSVFLYLILCLSVVLILANLPRDPMPNKPDWGNTIEHRVPTVRNKTLECWVVTPDQERVDNLDNSKKNAIILIHGWGRNRGRMVSRARIYGKFGYTTIIFSARDHGGSDKELIGMSIIRFSEDLNACINWWGKPVIINGHSIGAGAALLVGAQNPLVKGIIAESPPYAFPANFKHVYQPALKILTPLFLPGIKILTLYAFRRIHSKFYSPLEVAHLLNVPTFIIHGKEDEIFPYKNSQRLRSHIKNCILWTPDEGNHSNLEELTDYNKKLSNFLIQNNL
jgi:pimeloyl-ACP methyl ester carboxylesterase